MPRLAAISDKLLTVGMPDLNPNLVVNGYFNNGFTGWDTTGIDSATIDLGVARLSESGAGSTFAQSNIPTVNAEQYSLSFAVLANAADVDLRLIQESDGQIEINQTIPAGADTYSYTFTATGEVEFQLVLTSGDDIQIDNVQIRRA